jgi:salicylate hydroxylase
MPQRPHMDNIRRRSPHQKGRPSVKETLSNTAPTVAIVGGGLGGLAAALALRRAGIDATVYEMAPERREAGAGIVVPPNMVHVLVHLGLADALPDFAVRLEAAWEFRRWSDGQVLFRQPMGDVCVERYGAACYVAHRADLMALLQAALPPGTVQQGWRCSALTQDADGVDLSFTQDDGSRSQVRADAAIGADGIHSALAPFVIEPEAARFSGLCAFRCLVPAEAAPSMALRPVQTLWLGPGRHFVHYPISGGRLVNVVAIVPAGDWRTESWTAPGEVADLRREFEGWDPRLQQLVDAATETRRWALYDRNPATLWTRGRAALLGDAAHAMLPFFAQGAAQALEDGLVLAECLRGTDRAGLPAALQRYDNIRRPRASRVQLMSRGRELRNHLPDGPEQQARDMALTRGDPLADSAWLYGHDLGADLAAARQV